MLINRHQVTVEWGHCDPAGIVYFPNYFSYFDSAANALFLRALGLNKYQMLRKYDLVGIPVVDVGARFAVPSVFGDVVTIESTVVEIKRSSFRMQTSVAPGRDARSGGPRDAGLGWPRPGGSRQAQGLAHTGGGDREA